MKHFFYLSLLVVTFINAADEPFVDDASCALYDEVVHYSLQRAKQEVQNELTGTVPELYGQLHELGSKQFIAQHPQAVAQAKALLKILSQEEGASKEVLAAINAKKTAQNLPKDASREEQLQAWGNELKAFGMALIATLRGEAPKDFEPSALLWQRIVANNGKQFDEQAQLALASGTIAVIKDFADRRKTMGDELFNAFLYLQQPTGGVAHQSIQSIN